MVEVMAVAQSRAVEEEEGEGEIKSNGKLNKY